MEKYIWRGKWWGGETGGYVKACEQQAQNLQQNDSGIVAGAMDEVEFGDRSSEHASYIMEALETGRPYRGHFNVENTGLIANLPSGCTVELPCYVDASGVHPTYIGALPLACAATCRASISVQEMAVEAALTGDRELVKQAVLHDPLTAAVCTPKEVWAMCDELFAAHAAWLPHFKT